MKRQHIKKIGIFGENVLIIGDKIIAFYITKKVNYKTLNRDAREKHIQKMTNTVQALSSLKSDLKISYYKIDKIITADNIKKNLIDTVHIWDPSYNEIPPLLANSIEDNTSEYCLMAVHINNIGMLDIENASVRELVNKSVTTMSQKLFSLNNIMIDYPNVVEAEKVIADTISGIAVRASKEMVFYSYISVLYPSYNISYNRNSYVERNLSKIIGAADQLIENKFGYFIMHNNGVNLFGLEPKTTYGCLLEVYDFPETIFSENFNMNIDNLRINMDVPQKNKAKLLVKRRRADIEFEKETGESVNARDLEYLDDKLRLTKIAMETIDNNGSMADFNVHILLVSNSLDTLKSNKRKLISNLLDKDVVVRIAPDQGSEYIKNYITMSPGNYRHFTDLSYPLSFQIDQGTDVGDGYSKYYSLPIGSDANL